MPSKLRRLHNVFFEIGSFLLFFGSLATDANLRSAGVKALGELKERGFTIPGEEEPLRIYPLSNPRNSKKRLEFSETAGAWRPGIISLREAPEGGQSREVYLRHELMHEVSARTCNGKLPVWVEEAQAIAFSGEAVHSSPPTYQAIENLKKAIRIEAPLCANNYETLRGLIGQYGWPSKPCDRSEPIAAILKSAGSIALTRPNYLVLSLLTGRVLESSGDMNEQLPLGSLLKIPYAAALDDAETQSIGMELLKSDTHALALRRSKLNQARWLTLLKPIGDFSAKLPDWLDAGAVAVLGERDGYGNFPIESSLLDAAQVLRLSLFMRPDVFRVLGMNGSITGSTLADVSAETRYMLRQMHALAKTGTASNVYQMPVLGLLAVAWPYEHPVYLAVMRTGGARGAMVSEIFRPVLKEISDKYPLTRGAVRVKLLSRLEPSQFHIESNCSTIERRGYKDEAALISPCGDFKISTLVPSAREIRFVSGVLVRGKEEVILETDLETYADMVLEAEAAELQGEARKALRAVIVWNGLHGRTRHPWHGLCDTTHCMVMLGRKEQTIHDSRERTDQSLLRLLEEFSRKQQQGWFPFEKGGDEPWQKVLSEAEVEQSLGESLVLGMVRHRLRDGGVEIQLTYGTGAETVACENFRSKFKMLSCPDRIAHETDPARWVFTGHGAGHGQGLSVVRAQELSGSGMAAAEILREAYLPKSVASLPR